MNLEAINKWLDEEYGCSYTKLEELHDFYFEKYCDLKKENKQLKDNWNKLREWIVYNKHNENTKQHYLVVDYGTLLGKMREIEQGSDSNE
jgi:hypothetical protein